ncbi:MAG: hypothetical protein ACOYNS_03670 [Bacteroidota bacterium]
MYDFFTSAFSNTPKVDPLRQSSFDRYAKVEIDRARFEEVFSKRGIPAAAIDTLFKSMDINGDGRVNQADVQRVLHLYGQRHSANVSGADRNTVKNPDAADNDVSREEKNRNTHQTPLDADTVEKLIEQMEKRAGTYNRFGLRHFSAIGAFVNSFA